MSETETMTGQEALGGLFALFINFLLGFIQFAVLGFIVSASVVDMLAHGISLWSGMWFVSGVSYLLYIIFHRK